MNKLATGLVALVLTTGCRPNFQALKQALHQEKEQQIKSEKQQRTQRYIKALMRYEEYNYEKAAVYLEQITKDLKEDQRHPSRPDSHFIFQGHLTTSKSGYLKYLARRAGYEHIEIHRLPYIESKKEAQKRIHSVKIIEKPTIITRTIVKKVYVPRKRLNKTQQKEDYFRRLEQEPHKHIMEGIKKRYLFVSTWNPHTNFPYLKIKDCNRNYRFTLRKTKTGLWRIQEAGHDGYVFIGANSQRIIKNLYNQILDLD